VEGPPAPPRRELPSGLPTPRRGNALMQRSGVPQTRERRGTPPARMRSSSSSSSAPSTELCARDLCWGRVGGSRAPCHCLGHCWLCGALLAHSPLRAESRSLRSAATQPLLLGCCHRVSEGGVKQQTYEKTAVPGGRRWTSLPLGSMRRARGIEQQRAAAAAPALRGHPRTGSWRADRDGPEGCRGEPRARASRSVSHSSGVSAASGLRRGHWAKSQQRGGRGEKHAGDPPSRPSPRRSPP